MNTATLPNLLDTLKTEGGFTYLPETNDFAPPAGFAIAVPGTERIIGNNLVTREAFAVAFADVAEDLLKYAKEYTRPGVVQRAIGGWYSEDRGVYMVELAEIWHVDRELAIDFGKARDQEAIYDLSTGEEIKTGGRGDHAGEE